MVSTVASGDTRPYVGASDITMMYSVVDIAGVNRISARIMANAAGAIAGMARRRRVPAAGGEQAADRRDDVRRHDAVRHPRARAARGARLRGARLPRDRHRRAVDGGARSGRLPRRRARRRRRPSWPTSWSAASSRPGPSGSRRRAGSGCRRSSRSARSTWSTSGRSRPCRREFARPQPLRAQRDGDADADDAGGVRASSGAGSARKLDAATGPTALFIPLRGVSMIAVEGGVFHDAGGGRGAVRRRCARRWARRRGCTRLDLDINDPAFARAMADRLHELTRSAA